MTSTRLRRLIAALVAATVPLALVSACAGSSGTTVTAQFQDAAGLFTGNDVGVLGVRVGEVTEITPRGAYVDVQLTIDEGVKVPADAAAVVVSRSVATDRYVELTPVYEGGAVLSSGAVIGADRTRSPVEFDALLSSLRRISDDLAGPDKDAKPVNDLLEVLSKNLDGNGATMAKGLKDLATALEDTNATSGDIKGNLKNLDTLTAALANNDALVRRFMDEVAEATEMLDDEHESVEATFDALSAMVREVTKFAREHREDISTQVEDMTAVVKAMVENRRRLSQLVETFPLMLQNVDRAIDENDRLSFRTRPADLLPGTAAFKVLCSNFPPGTCDGLEAGAATLFDLLARIAGVRTP
jgi:phospholipid/cholesterol/gamma-HCH transport system substrate-binding protein